MSSVKRWHMPRGTSVSEGEDGEFVLASDYDTLAAECERLRGEVSDLHTTMMAAAVEIQEHWDAHCDAEGYGPANLMHRLERGIASQYGYNAETVVCMEAQRDAALAELAALKGGREAVAWSLRREVDPCGLVRYMTQAKYEKQTEGVKAWYEPYKCASCEAPPAQASEWVPVSESLPADRRDVMLYCADTKEHFVGFSKGGGLFQFAQDGNGLSIVCRPSHWRYIEDSDAPTPGASDGKGGEHE